MFLENWLQKIFYKKISKLQKNRKAKYQYINKCNSVGLIINYDDNNILQKLDDLETILKSNGVNKIDKIFFTKQKKNKKKQFPKDTFSIFGLNWKKDSVVKNFLTQKYDVIINVNFNENYKVQYFSSLAKAHFKVSPYYPLHNFADLTLKLNKEPYFTQFLEALNKYLIK